MTFALTFTCLFASPSLGLDVPPHTGRIVDLAHLLPPDVAAALSAELEAHEAKAGNQVALLTLPSLEGEPLEDFSHRVATTWKLGRKGTDNGVLLLVVTRERKVRIEVGYGLEGTLTDARASRIIRGEIVPRFRAGDFPGGIAAGLRAIVGTIEGAYAVPAHPPAPQAPAGFSAILTLLLAVLVGTVIGLLLSARRHRARGLLGSVFSFSIAQSASLWLGVLAALATFALILWLVTLPPSRRRRARTGFDFEWGPPVAFGGDAIGPAGEIGFSGGGGDFGGGGASGDW
ncbi:MAG: TPM domain-containing protein [Nitrospirota bacterium]